MCGLIIWVGMHLIYHHYLKEGGATSGVKRYLTKIEAMSDANLDIIEELGNFRGSELSLAYYQVLTGNVRTYNLFFLLRWADLESWTAGGLQRI